MTQDPDKIIKSAGGLEKYYKIYDEVFTAEISPDEKRTKVKKISLFCKHMAWWRKFGLFSKI